MARIFGLVLVGFLIANCSAEHRREDVPEFSDKGKSVEAIPFSEVVARVFEPAGCFDCHAGFKKYDRVLKSVVTGDHTKSRLWLRASTDMPPIEEGYLPLEQEQVDLIRDWINQGARNE